MRVVAGVAVLSSLVLVGAAPARPPALPAEKAALTVIAKAVAAGRIDPSSAADGRAVVESAAALARHVPPARRTVLVSSIGEIAALGGKLTDPRAEAVFTQLEVNTEYLALHKPPAPQTDLIADDGILYRWFSGPGFVFHPLGNFAALNTALGAGDTETARRLAEALLARGVPQAGGGLAWEYYFDFGGGRAPWTSGMAQAVAAQAFAATAAAGAGDTEALFAAARSAYRTIPGRLVQKRATGPWIRLYSFNRSVVLNAQLQAVLSLRAYARATSDTDAAALASRLQEAAASELSNFDTGYWTYYSLPHNPSPLDYHEYVISMLKKLSPADARFSDAAKRFAVYESQPPIFRLADGGVGAVRFWLSKPASVELTAVGPAKRLSLSSGWHDVHWAPRRPGIYPVKLIARDPAGNSATIEALPIVKVVAAPREPGRSPLAVVGAGAAPAATPHGLVVGAGVDDPSQTPLTVQEKLGAIRFTVSWPLGATVPDAATVQTLRQLARGTRLIVELAADPTPADDETRAALATYAASLVRQVPALRDLLLGPAPVTATAAAYALALAAVYDAVKGTRSTVSVGALVDGAAGPKATLAATAAAYRTTGRATPMFDELAFRPAASATGRRTWTAPEHARLTAALSSAFGGTPQPADPPVLIDGLAVETAVPAAKASSYLTPPVPSTAVSEAEQATLYVRALAGAACGANVTAVLLERLVDGPGPGEQSGLFYADGTAKPSAGTAASAFAAAARGELASCAGSVAPATTRPAATPAPAPIPTSAPTEPAVPAEATGELVFPTGLSRSSAPAVRVGCVLDCLYLVTLERADGKPVLARRGALASGKAPTTVRLPKLPLAPGSYTLNVRIVAQTRPGPIELRTSPTLALS